MCRTDLYIRGLDKNYVRIRVLYITVRTTDQYKFPAVFRVSYHTKWTQKIKSHLSLHDNEQMMEMRKFDFEYQLNDLVFLFALSSLV